MIGKVKAMRFKALLILPLAGLVLTGCTNEEMGALFGATAGALIGSQIGSGHEGTMAAIAGLSLAGAYIGAEIGEDIDDRDRAYMQRRTQYTLERGPSGQPSNWNNPDTGSYGTVTPAPAYIQEGLYCRPYTQTITTDDGTRTTRGTACRQKDGTWLIVDTGS